MRGHAFATVRAFISILILNSVFGLFAYPLVSPDSAAYFVLWVGNAFFGVVALFFAVKIPHLLPEWSGTIARVFRAQFAFQVLIAGYYCLLQARFLPTDLLVTEILALSIGAGVWYVVIASIICNVKKHAEGDCAFNPKEMLFAVLLFVTVLLTCALGFLGFPAQS